MITAKCRVCGRRYWFNHASWQAECCAKEDKMLDIGNPIRVGVLRAVERRKMRNHKIPACCICSGEMNYDNCSDCYHCPNCGVNFHPKQAYDEAVKRVSK